MNIPIYRAKTKSKDGYIEGIVSPDGNFIIVEIKVKKAISQIVITEAYEIDPTTLAIHFPDMLDNQGNKIFASLSNAGGSILTDGVCEFNLYFDGRKYRIIGNEINSEINDYEEWKDFKAIGIQE